jgi:hypothetical protein
MMSDYKDRIQRNAEIIALEEYDSDFYSLPAGLQFDVYVKAQREYVDQMAEAIDRATERELVLS